jgi:TMEM175 potassium channel family protein
MTDTEPAGRRRRLSLRTSRMEALSDGIFAIAATLLVLDLAIPKVSLDVSRSLLEQWPTYLAYLVSFATIGNAWLNHSVITEYLERADAILLRLNLVLLFFVSVLPFPTHMLAEYISSENAERVAVTVYGLNLLAIGAFTSLTWHYAVAEHLVSRDNSEDDVRAISAKLDPSLAFYAVAIGIGLLWPTAAVVLYLVIALFVIIPFRAVFRRLRQARRGGRRHLTGQD